MKLIKYYLTVFLFLCGTSQSIANEHTYKKPQSDIFYIVESVPAETELEKSTLPRALDVWLEMINSAEESIDIETFYFANEKGEVLEKIIKAITDAAKRGVKVRVIVDESFYQNNEKSVDEIDNVKNITVKKIPFKKIAGGVMHAKYFVVDKEDLFMGSQNMDWRALKHIHEIGVRIRNEKMAQCFLNIFEMDWILCDSSSKETIKKLKALKYKNIITVKKPLRINTEEYGNVFISPAFSPQEATPKEYNKEITELIRIIKNSKKKLYIHIFSYSLKGKSKSTPFDKIDREIRLAATRGVDVKIIFSDWAIKDGAIEDIKSLSSVPGIEIKFSSIPEYSGGFIQYSRVEHVKYFISDKDISWISTSNWESSYFNDCRNSTLIMRSEKVNTRLEEVFLRTWNSKYAEKVNTEKDYKPVKKK